MKRRLPIDSTVLDFAGRLRKRDDDFLFRRFEEIRESPPITPTIKMGTKPGALSTFASPVDLRSHTGTISRIAI